MTLAQAYFWQFGEVSYPFKIHDANGNETYSEYSNGYWCKSEYDSNGKITYSEDSDGETYGKKQSDCDEQTIEIDGVKYSAEQVRERIAELKPMEDKREQP